jgi:GT2 family glycosyltransferase
MYPEQSTTRAVALRSDGSGVRAGYGARAVPSLVRRSPPVATWAVLLTTHERRETTLGCLDALAEQRGHGRALRVVVVDAASTDGTPAAVAAHPLGPEVLAADASTFWNQGMRLAWSHVADDPAVAACLWLNDDTRLDPDALARLAAVHEAHPGAIVVGATRDPDTGAVTYSGVHRPDRRRPLAFARVPPDPGAPVPVETMNGNCVLVPRAVQDRVGLLDATFTHGMGDFDYGLRARAAGVEVLLAPGTVGTCRANVAAAPADVATTWRRLRGPKGLPTSEWVEFARRWAGPLWPVYAASPYVRRLVRAARGGG